MARVGFAEPSGADCCSRCAHVAGQIQRQHRVCLPAEFQDIAEYLHPPVRRHVHALTLLDTFAKHNVDKPIPVEALVKCKMQDNLEFLQFAKRYWDQYFPGDDYDPLARRKGQAGLAGGPAPRASAPAARRAPAASNSGAPRTRTPLTSGGGAASAALREENNVLKETVAGLERERDFYFSKLRDIELLIQQAMEADPELEKEDGLLKQIQTILYSTEEGFEIPQEGEVGEEETF